ncbi:hypothetical protein FB45DRAFT_874634 [Roridomyces roridus]|uniref:Uncharacterized protein n=1 Tax=Roridomyces roridus TaxID=1738132 RepID=A0AAD7FD60_9AGAR|nr:hypothetical protein FB45DRAFT_874634 [Roridomyces roridus]
MSDDNTYQLSSSPPTPSDTYEESQLHQDERDERESLLSPASRAAAKDIRLERYREQRRTQRMLINSSSPLLKKVLELQRSPTPNRKLKVSPTPTRPRPRSSAVDGRAIIRSVFCGPCSTGSGTHNDHSDLYADGGALNSQTGDGTYIDNEIEARQNLDFSGFTPPKISFSPRRLDEEDDDLFSLSGADLDLGAELECTKIRLQTVLDERDLLLLRETQAANSTLGRPSICLADGSRSYGEARPSFQ